MHRRLGLGLGALLGGAIALWPMTAWGRVCRPATVVPASAERREFRVDEFGVALQIPGNYRSVLRSSGHVTFHDPGAFELIQCLARTGEYREVPPYSALEIHQGIQATADLEALVRVKRPWVDFYSPDYRLVNFAGQPAIAYEYTNEIYQLAIANISFISTNGSALLTLTGPASHPIMAEALATLDAEPFSLEPLESLQNDGDRILPAP